MKRSFTMQCLFAAFKTLYPAHSLASCDFEATGKCAEMLAEAIFETRDAPPQHKPVMERVWMSHPDNEDNKALLTELRARIEDQEASFADCREDVQRVRARLLPDDRDLWHAGLIEKAGEETAYKLSLSSRASRDALIAAMLRYALSDKFKSMEGGPSRADFVRLSDSGGRPLRLFLADDAATLLAEPPRDDEKLSAPERARNRKVSHAFLNALRIDCGDPWLAICALDAAYLTGDLELTPDAVARASRFIDAHRKTRDDLLEELAAFARSLVKPDAPEIEVWCRKIEQFNESLEGFGLQSLFLASGHGYEHEHEREPEARDLVMLMRDATNARLSAEEFGAVLRAEYGFAPDRQTLGYGLADGWAQGDLATVRQARACMESYRVAASQFLRKLQQGQDHRKILASPESGLAMIKLTCSASRFTLPGLIAGFNVLHPERALDPETDGDAFSSELLRLLQEEADIFVRKSDEVLEKLCKMLAVDEPSNEYIELFEQYRPPDADRALWRRAVVGAANQTTGYKLQLNEGAPWEAIVDAMSRHVAKRELDTHRGRSLPAGASLAEFREVSQADPGGTMRLSYAPDGKLILVSPEEWSRGDDVSSGFQRVSNKTLNHDFLRALSADCDDSLLAICALTPAELRGEVRLNARGVARAISFTKARRVEAYKLFRRVWNHFESGRHIFAGPSEVKAWCQEIEKFNQDMGGFGLWFLAVAGCCEHELKGQMSAQDFLSLIRDDENTGITASEFRKRLAAEYGFEPNKQILGYELEDDWRQRDLAKVRQARALMESYRVDASQFLLELQRDRQKILASPERGFAMIRQRCNTSRFTLRGLIAGFNFLYPQRALRLKTDGDAFFSELRRLLLHEKPNRRPPFPGGFVGRHSALRQ